MAIVPESAILSVELREQSGANITVYKHVDFGNIKLAFTRICEDELFEGVYFAANTLYYVQSGTADLFNEASI